MMCRRTGGAVGGPEKLEKATVSTLGILNRDKS
jgi:hypothetical protein